jgi:hypothetical protein
MRKRKRLEEMIVVAIAAAGVVAVCIATIYHAIAAL